MTRHGLIRLPVTGAQPAATDPRVSMVIPDAEKASVQTSAGPTTPRGDTTKRSVRIHLRASQRWWPHPRHQPKSEISIAIDCGLRVPSSGTFVRLPAPETLHGTRRSAGRFV